eukprot:SAG31_NODE_354_length_17223_cov_18.708771_2_plen_63_part_00
MAAIVERNEIHILNAGGGVGVLAKVDFIYLYQRFRNLLGYHSVSLLASSATLCSISDSRTRF